jgi:hypothetical protein
MLLIQLKFHHLKLNSAIIIKQTIIIIIETVKNHLRIKSLSKFSHDFGRKMLYYIYFSRYKCNNIILNIETLRKHIHICLC